MSIPSQRTIKRRLKELRTLIDTNKDPCVTRIAYGMECALRWSILDTTGWKTPAEEALLLGAMLRKELSERG